MPNRTAARWYVPILLLPALAGCTGQAQAEPPDPAPSVISTTVYSGIGADCPDLTSDAARELGVGGEGEPTEFNDTTVIDCVWEARSPGWLRIDLRMTVHRTPAQAVTEWQLTSIGQERKMRFVGNEAFSAVEMPALVVRARQGSAVATIRFAAPEEMATEEFFEDLRPAATEICQDVLDDLR